jgi:hypothetical protein
MIDSQNGAPWSNDVVLINFIPVSCSDVYVPLDKLGRRGTSTLDEILEYVEVQSGSGTGVIAREERTVMTRATWNSMIEYSVRTRILSVDTLAETSPCAYA